MEDSTNIYPGENKEDNLSRLLSEDSSVKCEAIESLINEDLSEETVNILCRMVDDPDKSVQNSVHLVLTMNECPYIPTYLIRYISSKKIVTRNLAGEILLKKGVSSVQAMLRYLKSANDDDIKFIVDIVGLIGDPCAAPEILEVLKVNKNDNVILACIEALGNLKYEEALETIIGLFRVNELYQPTIFESIGKIGSEQALDFLTSNFHQNDDLTKFSIIESLGLIGNEETLFFLISELTETNGPLIWPIIESIFNLKEKYGLDIPFDERMKNLILNTIYDADTQYKKTAAKLVTAFDSEEIMPACIKLLGDDFETDEIIKPKVFEAPREFFKLVPSYIHVNPTNLKSILELSAELLEAEKSNNQELISPLQVREFADACTKCLENPDEEIRKLGIEILFTIDQGIALLFLDRMLEDNSIWNKLRLLEILYEINSREAEQGILALANDNEVMISERAKSILGEKTGNNTVLNTEEKI